MISSLADIIAIVGILLLGYVICFHYNIHNDFGPILSISFIVVINVICGYMSILWISSCFLMFFCYAFFVAYNYIKIERNKRAHFFIQYISSPGIIGYLFSSILFLVIYTFVKEPQYVAWDDLMHWGMFYKNVFYFHNFDVWNNTFSFMHQSYPQGGAALYSFFAVLQRNYHEKDVFISLNSLIFAATTSIFAFFKNEKSKKRMLLIYIMAISGVPFLYYQFMRYTMTYMDIPLGVSFAAALCIVATHCPIESKKKMLAVELGMLTSIKQIGIFFSIIVIIIWGLYCINIDISNSNERKTLFWEKKRKYVRQVFSVAIIPVSVFALWNVLLRFLGKNRDQFNAMEMQSFYGLWKSAKSGSDSYFYDIAKLYIETIFEKKIILNHFSIFSFTVIIFILSILLYAAQKKTKKKYKYMIYSMPIFLLVYLCILFYVYICGMSRAEGYELASFSRYIATFFIGWIQVLLCNFIIFMTEMRKRKVANLFYALVVLICLSNMFFAIKTDGISSMSAGNEARKKQIENDQKVISVLKQDSDQKNERVVILMDSADSYEKKVFLEAIPYDIFPYITDCQDWYCNELDNIDFINKMEDNKIDYVIIFQVSGEFFDRNASFFDDGLKNVCRNFSYDNKPFIYKPSDDKKSMVNILVR